MHWNFGTSGITETVTIKGITKSYTAAGQIQFCACSTDATYINTSGSGPGFNGSFVGTNKFFSHMNVNNPNLLLDFTEIALTSGDFGSYNLGSGGGTSFGLTPRSLSANRSVAAVPKPINASILVMGFAGAFAARRRRPKKAAA